MKIDCQAALTYHAWARPATPQGALLPPCIYCLFRSSPPPWWQLRESGHWVFPFPCEWTLYSFRVFIGMRADFWSQFLNPVVFTAFNEVYRWFGHLDRMHTRNTFMSVNFSRDLHVNPNPSSLLLIYNGIYIKKVYNSTYKFEFCLLVLLSKQKSKELKCCSLAFQNANDWRIWRERLFIGSGYVIAIFRD